MNQLTCTCGYQVHAENARDTRCPAPAPATLTCRCGTTTSFGDFDQHLLDIFTPADRIGRDGNKHASTD